MISKPRVHTIAVIPGDGIGTEVTAATIEILQKVEQDLGDFQLRFTHIDWNSENYLRQGYYIPENGLELLERHDAILLGAVGSPDVPDHISLWGLLLPIRKTLNQYVNVRPVHILPGVASPLKNCKVGDLDWVIVRENSEGEYAGQGGTSHGGTPNAIATEVAIFTHAGIERTMRFAFETALSRPRKQLTLVTKSNAQRHGMVLWDQIFDQIRPEYPEVSCDKMLVDAMTVRMVQKPQSLDTIVATNLHGDILSDLAAALSGSIGIAPSSNLDPSRQHPSMFEPIHGSAPDIAGRGVANPLGTIASAAEMLKWLGEDEAAAKIVMAIDAVTVAGTRTRDLGGQVGTEQVTKAIIDHVQSQKTDQSFGIHD
ncbi:hypothetical protein H2200_003199 [Cladophialophora chaetospira]|uniref:D-malate dehydrogenase (decarboxylating) n=1 Tax=Cladophialophora chaetospira TaxID=386627 RepID=A0AA38XH18_9EURO|nr:hypothetical protein H2200_003199 [Cladophialophora chaetospira]